MRRLGTSPLERIVRSLLLLLIFLLPFGAALLLSESQADVAGRYNQFAVPKLYAIEVLALVASGLWLVLRGFAQPARPFRHLIVVVGLAGLSFLWAPYPLLAAVTAGHLATALLLLYVLSYEFRDRRFLGLAFWTLTASAAVQALWALGQFTLGRDFGAQLIGESDLAANAQNVAKLADGHIRAYGTLPHPNLLAAFLATAIFWVGTVIFWPFAKRDRWRQGAYAGLLVVLGSALLLTFSRVALALTAINGLLVALFSYRKWHRLPTAAGVAAIATLIVALLLLPQLMNRTTLESPQETGVSNRIAGIRLANTMIADRPLGVGAGNFVVAAPELRELPAYQYQPTHVTPLLIGAELGGVAMLLVLWFVAKLGWAFHFLKPRDRRENTLNFALFALAGACVAMGLADHFFWSSVQGLLLITIITAAVISRLPASRFRDL